MSHPSPRPLQTYVQLEKIPPPPEKMTVEVVAVPDRCLETMKALGLHADFFFFFDAEEVENTDALLPTARRRIARQNISDCYVMAESLVTEEELRRRGMTELADRLRARDMTHAYCNYDGEVQEVDNETAAVDKDFNVLRPGPQMAEEIRKREKLRRNTEMLKTLRLTAPKKPAR